MQHSAPDTNTSPAATAGMPPAPQPASQASSSSAASAGQASSSSAASAGQASSSPAASAGSAAPVGREDDSYRRTRHIARWATVAVLAAAVAACLLIPAARETVGSIFAMLSSGDTAAVAELIRSFGPWAVAVSFCLMVLQSLAAPIPAFLITFANAAVFGWWQGAILSWTSAMAGAVLCFAIARMLGRDAVAHFATHGALETVDRYFARYGANTILICRLLPFVSFDLVSYAAGLTSMRWWSFLWATGVGQLPATLVYSYVGGMLTGGTKLFVTALLLIFALSALVFLVKQVVSARQRDKNQHGEDAAAHA